MTESFYLRVDVTSDEDLEFYEDRDDGEYVEIPCPPKTRERFNRQVEKAIKRILMENVDMIGETLDEDEGLGIEKQSVLEDVASRFYDPETDLTATTECMIQDIKFTVVRNPTRTKK